MGTRTETEKELDAIDFALQADEINDVARRYPNTWMWSATMHTEHYRWTAFGVSQREAHEALRRGFLDEGGDPSVADRLEDEYGVEVLRVEARRCYRDGLPTGVRG